MLLVQMNGTDTPKSIRQTQTILHRTNLKTKQDQGIQCGSLDFLLLRTL